MREQILEIIIDHIKEKGYPPTCREIGNAIDMRNPTLVRKQLEIMNLTGMIKTDGTPRAIQVPGMKYMTMDEMDHADWIPIDRELPGNDDLILLSFENVGIVGIGLYMPEEKLFYLEDMKTTCKQFDFRVNAWRPLPRPYRRKKDEM